MKIGIVIPYHNDKIFEDNINKSLDKIVDSDVRYVKIADQINDSIFKKYNRGIEYFKKEGLSEGDIVIFAHEDSQLIDPVFFEKIKMVFELKKDVGVLGFIGTSKLDNSAAWWMCEKEQHRGRIAQGHTDGSTTELLKKVGYFEDLVMVDGFCFATRFELANSIKFDDITFDGWHFYDADYCLSVLDRGYKIAVADILSYHMSTGPLTPDWFKSRSKFIDKWTKKGFKFPITLNSFKNK